MTRTLRRLVFLGTGLVFVVSVLFAMYWNRRPVPQSFDLSKGPISPSAQVGKAYRFSVGHCGLVHIVDFDKSYWEVDESTLTQAENDRFGINGDRGTMTLLDRNTANYRSDSGGEASLSRIRGVKDFFPCS